MSSARALRAALALFPVLFAVGVVLSPLGARQKKGRKVALLVAVQDYTGSGMSNLKYCENDVTELAKALASQGYDPADVTVLTSTAAFERKKENLFPTAENVRLWLKGIVEDLHPEDTVLLAFSGHGVHLKELKDKGLHFCPKGAKLDDPKTLVSLAEVYDRLEKDCKAGVKLLVVDACRNDPTDGRSGGDARLESRTRPLVPDPPGGTVAFFSCSTGQMAFESDALKHGIFFHHFIQGLKGGPADAPIARDGEVTVPLLEDYLTRAVPVAVKKDKGDPSVRQIPERKGSVRGQVVLATVAKASVEVRPPVPKVEPKTAGGGEVAAVQPKAGEERSFEIATGVKMVFCWIPAGKATLGSPKTEKDRNDDEAEREFATKGFWLGKYEATQAEWAAITGQNPSWFSKDGLGKVGVEGLNTGRFPVEQVSWNDCHKFLDKVNARGGAAKVFGGAGKFALPHEDEWEYAARGGRRNQQAFYWGDALNGTEGNCNGNKPYGTDTKGRYLDRPCPVDDTNGGKYPAHPWGLHHMAGNISEWCENKQLLRDSSFSMYAHRGGSWHDDGRRCRPAVRGWNVAEVPDLMTGFRVCFRPDR